MTFTYSGCNFHHHHPLFFFLTILTQQEQQLWALAAWPAQRYINARAKLQQSMQLLHKREKSVDHKWQEWFWTNKWHCVGQRWQGSKNLRAVYDEAITILHKIWKKYMGNILIHPPCLRSPEWRDDYPAVTSGAGLKGGQTSSEQKVSKAQVRPFWIVRKVSASSSVEGITWWRAPVCLSKETQTHVKTFLVEEGMGKRYLQLFCWAQTHPSSDGTFMPQPLSLRSS